LASLAEFKLDSDVGAIVRIDGRRVNEVKAYLVAGVLPSAVVEEFTQRLRDSEFALPAGYQLEFGGEAEQRSNAVNNLIANAVVLFALMLLTLVASFRSFRCALIVAAVGGLSIGLGPMSLAVFDYPFGFMAIVGTMGLVGLAINDSIVVLAAIRASQPARCGDVPELIRVVSGCTRHIIATSMTTIVGFLPLILGGGGFWPPLAITIAGGVGAATLLALYFVPALYLLLYYGTKKVTVHGVWP
jgi:multidrug efflux pump subunit AcrB